MPRILLVGGDADFNVGDAAIQHAVCTVLTEFLPSLRISVVSARADNPRFLPGVDVVLPKGASHAFAQWRAAGRHDMVVVGGGGLFQDDDSRIKMPYWASRLAALRLAAPVIAGHSLGAGPLSHAESRWCARLACSQMNTVTVRDEFALRALQPCTSRQLRVVPDPAFMLEASPASEARRLLEQCGVPIGTPLVGVVVRRWFHARGGFVPHRIRARFGVGRDVGSGRMEVVLEELASAVAKIAQQLQADVVLLPSYLAGHEDDQRACAMLAARVKGIRTHTVRVSDPMLYKAVTGRLSLLVSARMHPLILASGSGVPLVGIGYNGKFGGCMEALGAGDQLLWIEELARPGAAEQVQRCASLAMANARNVATRAAALAEQGREGTRALLEMLS